MFSEVTEVRDGVQFIAHRCINEEVGKRLVQEMKWYDKYLKDGGVDRGANTTPGNKKGGLSNIIEKSMGSNAKSGTSPIVEVLSPGEKPTKHGEIYAVPGVDMIQFGPNDYCLSNGWNNEGAHVAAAKEAERKCIEAALRHGVRPRCEINKPEEAEYYIALGVKDFSLGDQLRILKGYWNGEGGKLREIAEGLT